MSWCTEFFCFTPFDLDYALTHSLTHATSPPPLFGTRAEWIAPSYTTTHHMTTTPPSAQITIEEETRKEQYLSKLSGFLDGIEVCVCVCLSVLGVSDFPFQITLSIVDLSNSKFQIISFKINSPLSFSLSCSLQIKTLATKFCGPNGVEVKNRKYHMKVYKMCFIGRRFSL
jgi:hypothetical protein